MSPKRKTPGKHLKKRNTKPSAIILMLAVGIIFSAVISINERYLNIDSIPSWNDIFSKVELQTKKSVSLNGTAAVHFIDVGQGDSQLIMTEEYSILIDTGEREYAEDVINYLNQQNIQKLDYVIITHPHSDHAGGFGKIADEFPTQKIIMPDIKDEVLPTTATFERILDRIDKYGIDVIYPTPLEKIELGSSEIQFLGPVNDYKDLNNYSIVFKFIHGENSFLFTGDMEKESENDILEKDFDLSADVLKLAHHGSNSSSQKKFLQSVGGQYAVIGVGSPNPYGHPTDKILKRLLDLNYSVYRTDLDGNIVFISDGQKYEIISENDETRSAA